MSTIEEDGDDAAGESLIPRQIVERGVKDLHGDDVGDVGESGFVLPALIIGTASPLWG
jgi:hypothetical protein